ncbi:hypothetical protein [Kitasatospora sp. NPDC059327]|uniref:hypothetical protein n=1 Tax=Kitasatospora sp. NPDC059327 TaxID=3346803 RepID=UPI0036B6515D
MTGTVRVVNSSYERGDLDPESAERVLEAIAAGHRLRLSTANNRHGQEEFRLALVEYVDPPTGATRYAVTHERPEGRETKDSDDVAAAWAEYEEQARMMDEHGHWDATDVAGLVSAGYSYRMEVSDDEGATWLLKEEGEGTLSSDVDPDADFESVAAARAEDERWSIERDNELAALREAVPDSHIPSTPTYSALRVTIHQDGEVVAEHRVDFDPVILTPDQIAAHRQTLRRLDEEPDLDYPDLDLY